MVTFKKITKHEFEELKNKYYVIAEAIELYDSGKHPEYNEDWLNEQLDSIHIELCDAVSDIAQYLIDKIDETDGGAEVEVTGEDLDNIHYLNVLYDMAMDCKTYGESPEEFGLTNSYGNGVISSIGADFYVGCCKRSGYKYFGYKEFLQLLETYELITY